MRIVHRKVIDCSGMDSSTCSDLLLAKLQHGPNFKLRPDFPVDTVHGSVTIAHNLPPDAHEITIDIYDADEPPTADHRSTLRRPAVMPSQAMIRDRLNLP